MTFATFFAAIPSLLVCLGGVMYIHAIVRGCAQPHIGTWLIWTCLTALTGFGMWHADAMSAMIVTSIGIDIVIVTLSLTYGYWSWNRVDMICISIAVIGVIVYFITSVPLVAIVAGLTATVVATIPTLRKTLHTPETEPTLPYIIFFASCIFQIMNLPSWDLEHSLQPVVWLLNGMVILHCILMTDEARQRLKDTFA